MVPEPLDLDILALDNAILPDDGTVMLLSTEDGAQLLVAGFGLYIGKKGETSSKTGQPSTPTELDQCLQDAKKAFDKRLEIAARFSFPRNREVA